MRKLEVGDRIDIIRGSELQLILTVREVTDNTVKAVAANGYVSRYRREFDGVVVKPADPMADSAWYHTGNPPEHFNTEAKQRYYDKIKELDRVRN